MVEQYNYDFGIHFLYSRGHLRSGVPMSMTTSSLWGCSTNSSPVKGHCDFLEWLEK